MARVVKAASTKPDKKQNKDSIKDMAALVAYHYPQYTYEQALDLPTRISRRLLETVSKQKALEYLHLTQIAAAPHSKKGESVKKLIENYKKVLNG